MPESPNIQIQRIEEMRLGQQLDDQIADLLELCFDANYQGRSFYQNRHHCRILLWFGDQLVGHTAIVFRAVRQGNTVHDVVGLAEVAVHPDFRGRELATTLMNEAVQEGKRAGAEFALLFGVRRLYEACGFVQAGNEITWIPMENVQTGKVQTEQRHHLRVKPLSNKPWDDKTPLDLAGFAF